MENIKDWNVDIFKLFDERWALLTAGDREDFNTMTISWGSLGSLWAPRGNGRKIVTVYVKPSRHTFDYLQKNEYFTVSFLPEAYRKDLAYLGSHSGRDENKLAATELTPMLRDENTVGFAEAELTLVCRKLYSDTFDKEKIPQDVVYAYYKDEDPHHFFIGEIVAFDTL